MIPVHRVDSASLELLWHRDVFVDATLPFGLRSATKISAVALTIRGLSKPHYSSRNRLPVISACLK